MRIVGGKFRSRVLASFSGEAVRPTADRTKEALFNILALKVRGARALDLFAGSGALGLECLSRGAKEVVFNDLSKDSVAILKKNLSTLKIAVGEEVKIFNQDALSCLERLLGNFDLIFIDPPYRLEVGVEAVKKIAKLGLLAEGGVIVFERDKPLEEEISGLKITSVRKYGKAFLTFLEKDGEA
ncbi:MAG: 16S rRNA (guanine(966)-N(2))-methyltransferase RsmD [Clostridia bacterium]|nr:16S rRNA (guanine(966)-N(2))-methyltransferase RsmD [Clostridia bacterium]